MGQSAAMDLASEVGKGLDNNEALRSIARQASHFCEGSLVLLTAGATSRAPGDSRWF